MFFDQDETGPVGEIMVWADTSFAGVPIAQPIPAEGFAQGNVGDGFIQLEGSVG